MRKMSRKTFIGSLAALGGGPADLLLARLNIPGRPLDPASLRAIGRVVLPSALGAPGVDRVVASFLMWVRNYHTGAEVLHGYGTAELTSTPEMPVRRWAGQLHDLDEVARATHGKPFTRLTVEARETLIRNALKDQRVQVVTVPVEAEHVIAALVSHFVSSAEARDLCYGAVIGKERCRPLGTGPNRPPRRTS